MLNKEQLKQIGYEIGPDPDQPGMYLWRNGEDGSDISVGSEAAAILDANGFAQSQHELHVCDNCGAVHTEEMLKAIEDYSMRVLPGEVAPSGECVACGALCHPMNPDPDWEVVMSYFGLDTSFQYSAEDVIEWFNRYREAMSDVAEQSEALKEMSRLLSEADTYLREIRAENLDGSEPALGDLLDRVVGFWLKYPNLSNLANKPVG